MRRPSLEYSRVNLTPLLDIIFILLFLFLGSVSAREQEGHVEAERLARDNTELAERLVEVVARRRALTAEMAALRQAGVASAAREKQLAAELVSLQAVRDALVTRAREADVLEQRNAALTRQLAEATKSMERPHRTLAAARVLDRQFKVYELTLEPDHWVTLEDPRGEKTRRRVTPQTVEALLGQLFARGSVVLFFTHPKAIFGDVLAIRKALTTRGVAFTEYALPAEEGK